MKIGNELLLLEGAKLKIEDFGVGSFAATPSYLIGVNSSGEAVEVDPTTYLSSVPTLQEVTDAGSSTTNDIISISGQTSTASIFTSETGSKIQNAIGIETNGVTNQTRLFNDGTGTQLKIEALGNNASMTIAARTFVDIGTDHNGSDYGSYTSRVRVENSTGNVGINTTTPSAKLHVVGGAAANNANALLIENAEGDDLLRITDDNFTRLGLSLIHI